MKKTKLSELKNIGPKSEKWLKNVGIDSVEKLKKVGLKQAYQQMKARGLPVNVVMLYALQAGILDIHWNSLPQEIKDKLKKFADR